MLWLAVLGVAMVALVGCSGGEATVGECGRCHTEHQRAFDTSGHANASGSDLFRALRSLESPSRQAFCDRCHAPSAELGGTGAGLGCTTCHQATGNRETANGRLTVDRDAPLSGNLGRPAPHATRRSAFLASADLCGTCHEVQGGPGFDEPAFTEFQSSPAARDGLTCAGCHLATRPGDAASGRGTTSDGAPLSDHAFVGPDHPRAPELLGRSTAITLRRADEHSLIVTVENRNRAHALPSGIRFAREVTVTLEARTDDGVLHPVGEPIALGDTPTRMGARSLPHLADDATHDVIAPGASRAWTREALTVLEGRSVTAWIATVTYRRNARWLRETLGLPTDVRAPIVLARAELATATAW